MTKTRQSLTDRVALITGAAHRIGAQIARTLHANGMDLALHYRQSARAARALRQTLEERRPGSVLLLPADLCHLDALPELVRETHARFGRLDLLVNNASCFYPTPLGEIGPAQWDDLVNTNMRAPLFLSQAAAPLLRQHRGSIINLLDIHAERPLKEHPVYCMAKAGSAMMVKSLARELGPEVRVNGIAPGAILWPETTTPQAQQAILRRTALQRRGEAEDIAKSVLFLVRDADYITGQILCVDGGRSLQQ